MLQTKVTSEKVDYGWQLSNRPIVNLTDQAPILKELADNINTVEAAKDFLAEIAHMYGMEKVPIITFCRAIDVMLGGGIQVGRSLRYAEFRA